MGLRRLTRPKRLVAEFLGTALLLATVVGSGIMAEQLAGGNVALALLANAIATGAILAVLITIFGDISGAHFNPAVTIAFAIRGEIPLVLGLSYILVQIAGGLCGVILAHAMFELDIVQVSTHARSGAAQQLAEVVATFGLVATILGTLRVQPKAVAAMVGLYITAAYWFTASTSFANPAVTVARGFTNTFSGIEPTDIPGFILAQLIGAIIATYLFRWLEHADRQPQD
ncbi:MAG: aquaporin family protein [Gammaproteobacteria bacterium]|nr:aquaporin family protein [Gammaproteobacteria bacterium]